jgi:hypothetical protein
VRAVNPCLRCPFPERDPLEAGRSIAGWLSHLQRSQNHGRLVGHCSESRSHAGTAGRMHDCVVAWCNWRLVETRRWRSVTQADFESGLPLLCVLSFCARWIQPMVSRRSALELPKGGAFDDAFIQASGQYVLDTGSSGLGVTAIMPCLKRRCQQRFGITRQLGTPEL